MRTWVNSSGISSSSKSPRVDGCFVLNEGGDDLIQILLTDARSLLAFGHGKALDFDFAFTRLIIDADIALRSDHTRPRRNPSRELVHCQGAWV
jgi:hypothetical protein